MRRHRVSPSGLTAVVLAALCVWLVACGGSPATGPPVSAVDFIGMWKAAGAGASVDALRIVQDGAVLTVYCYPSGKGSVARLSGRSLTLELGALMGSRTYTISRDLTRLTLETSASDDSSPSPRPGPGPPRDFVRDTSTPRPAATGTRLVATTASTSEPTSQAPALPPLPGTGLQGYWRELGTEGGGMLLRIVHHADGFRVAAANLPAWPWQRLGGGVVKDRVLTVRDAEGGHIDLFVTPYERDQLVLTWRERRESTRLVRVPPAAASVAAVTIMDGNAHAVMHEAIGSLGQALERWAAANGGSYPPPAAVSLEGLGATAWTANPWTGEPVKQGRSPGDFTYLMATDRSGYTLIGHLAGGASIVLKGGSSR